MPLLLNRLERFEQGVPGWRLVRRRLWRSDYPRKKSREQMTIDCRDWRESLPAGYENDTGVNNVSPVASVFSPEVVNVIDDPGWRR